MKAVIVFTDDRGKSWEHELTLVPRRDSSARTGATSLRHGFARSAAKRPTPKATTASLDFSLPVRAFIKRYARRASGPRKFVILLARLSKGEMSSEVAFTEIEREWNRMTQLMGGRFHRSHAARARENGWVDSPKKGTYKLLSGWQSAIVG